MCEFDHRKYSEEAWGGEENEDYTSVEVKKVFYHYCSLDTFIKILKSKKIWLGNPCKMNDSQELLWYFNLIPEEIDFTVDEHGIKSKKISSIKSELLGFFKDSFYNQEIPYIASFSEDGDILSQWRSYADNGKGVSIGFEFCNFDDKAESDLTFKVISYNQCEQIDKILNIIRPLIDRNKLAGCGTTTYIDIISEIIRELLKDAVCSKNPAFIEEREARLIYNPEDDFCYNTLENKLFKIEGPFFRSLGNDITSYYELDFSDMKNILINSVYIGPKCKTTEHDIKMILKNMGYDIDDITIKKSVASYR